MSFLFNYLICLIFNVNFVNRLMTTNFDILTIFGNKFLTKFSQNILFLFPNHNKLFKKIINPNKW